MRRGRTEALQPEGPQLGPLPLFLAAIGPSHLAEALPGVAPTTGEPLGLAPSRQKGREGLVGKARLGDGAARVAHVWIVGFHVARPLSLRERAGVREKRKGAWRLPPKDALLSVHLPGHVIVDSPHPNPLPEGEGAAHPTVPSICNWMRRFISTAYSMGSSLTSGSMKPLTIIVLASGSVSPRLVR